MVQRAIYSTLASLDLGSWKKIAQVFGEILLWYSTRKVSEWGWLFGASTARSHAQKLSPSMFSWAEKGEVRQPPLQAVHFSNEECGIFFKWPPLPLSLGSPTHDIWKGYVSLVDRAKIRSWGGEGRLITRDQFYWRFFKIENSHGGCWKSLSTSKKN